MRYLKTENRQSGLRAAVAGGLVLTTLVLLSGLSRQVFADDDGPVASTVPAVAAIQTTRLVQRRVGSTIDAWGSVTVDARASQNLGFAVAGEVGQIKVVQGQSVHRGECMLTYKMAPEVTQSWQQAGQALQFAEGEQKRTASLAATGLATASQLAAAHRALQDARQAMVALRRQGADVASGQLCAPFDGWVQQVLVTSGQRVAANTSLLVLAPQAGRIVQLSVDPAAATGLRPGMRVSLDGMTESGQSTGKVLQVATAINPQTRMLEVMVSCPAGLFLPGQMVHGRLVLDPHPAWVVPRSAVLSDADGSYLFQVEHGHAHRVAVRVGDAMDNILEVSGRFDVQAPVVVSGNYELDEGMAVRGDGR